MNDDDEEDDNDEDGLTRRGLAHCVIDMDTGHLTSPPTPRRNTEVASLESSHCVIEMR